MDEHINSLEASLSALTQLHHKRGSISRRAQPFTNGILNKYDLDVLDFIRDADAFETNLFWYPAGNPSSAAAGLAPSSSRIAASTAVSGALLEESMAMAKQSLGAPQIPEPRQFVPPTPLRRGVTSTGAESHEQQEYDTRTLLKAAQKLMDNYHNAPRARKHVKALLRRNAELQKTIQNLDESLAETSDLIAKLSHPTQSKAFVSSVKRSQLITKVAPRKTADIAAEKKELLAAIRKEEMEIMAIEQTLEELLSQKGESSRRGDSETPKASTSHRKETEKKGHEGEEAMCDPGAEAPAAPALREDVADETIRLATTSTEGASEVQTIAPSSGVIVPSPVSVRPSDSTDKPHSTVQTSDELERICENIWTIFGDHLRFVLPGREGADLQETLAAVNNLSVGVSEAQRGDSTGDVSMASADGTSQNTVATSGSTVSSASTELPSAGPPTPTTMLAAHALAMLLTTPAPHTLDFDEIKRDSAEWWASIGLPSLRQQQQSRSQGDGGTMAVAKAIDALGPEIAEGDKLAVKAVYDLAAKKLLKIRFAGARRIVFFPANII